MPRNNSLTFSQNIAVGLMAGSLEVFLNHPLWVLKTRIQYAYEPRWAFQGIYKGLSANMAFMVPILAMRISLVSAIQNKYFERAKELSDIQNIASTVLGGCIPSLIGSPIEFMRAQQVKEKLSFHATTKIFLIQNGLRTIFRGMPGTAIRDSIYTCGFFALAPLFKRKITPYCENSTVASLISGSAAGCFAAFTSQPFDAIKMYQQLLASSQQITILGATKNILRADGITGFFKGATPRIIRVISGVTILSMANERITESFNDYNTKQKSGRSISY